GGAGQVAQARALVAEHDEMLLRAVGMSVIGVLHGDSPSRPAQCRPDALMPAGMPGRAICAGGDLSAGADDRRAASAGADEPVARTARSAPREAVRSTGWRRGEGAGRASRAPLRCRRGSAPGRGARSSRAGGVITQVAGLSAGMATTSPVRVTGVDHPGPRRTLPGFNPEANGFIPAA